MGNRLSPRLKSEKEIQDLLHSGKSCFVYPLKMTYKVSDADKVMFIAPKMYHKHAVARNLLKRRMREAYRRVVEKGEKCYWMAFRCVAKDLPPYERIERSMRELLANIETGD